MKDTLHKLGVVLSLLLFASVSLAEGVADRQNELSFGQDSQEVIKQIHQKYGSTAAGPMSKSAMMSGNDGVVKKHQKSWDDQSLDGLTAHERKRIIFGSNN